MEIYLGGEVDSDIFEPFRKIINRIESALNKFLNQKKYENSFLNIKEYNIYFIIHEDFNSDDIKFKYTKKNKTVEVEVALKYELFQIYDNIGKEIALLDSIIASIMVLENNNIITKDESQDLVSNINEWL